MTIKQAKKKWGTKLVCSNSGEEKYCFCQNEDVKWIPNWKYKLFEEHRRWCK